MTFDVEPEAPEEAIETAERLHEYAVNVLRFSTEDVLFTAHDDGTVTGELASGVASDTTS